MAYDTSQSADLFGGPELLTMRNLSDEEVVKDFAHELRQCRTDADYAHWARKWGEVTAGRLLEAGGVVDLEDNDDHQSLSDAFDKLTAAAASAVEALEKLAERKDVAESVAETLDSITDALAGTVTKAKEH